MKPIKTAGEYKGSKSYPFPDEDSLSQSQRSVPEYFLAACNAIVSRFVNNGCAVPYDNITGRHTFSELRAYRKGAHNPNKYKPYICGIGAQEVSDVFQGIIQGQPKGNKTTVNISWAPLPILAEKMDVVKGYMQKINYSPEISAIDYQSLVSKKAMVAMAKLMADPRMNLARQQVNQSAGATVIPEPGEQDLPGGAKFNSPKEVDLAASVGVFILEQESAMQSLLSKSTEDSVSEVVNDANKEDLLTLGIAGKRVYTNPNTHVVMEDYVDPEMAMIPYSKYLDHRDDTWGGEIIMYSIARLRSELKIEESELIRIAKLYASSDGTGADGGYAGFYYQIHQSRAGNGFGMNMMDSIQVPVADCKWIGKKKVRFTEVTKDSGGQLVTNRVRDDYKLSTRDAAKGKRLNEYENNTVYKAKMVLGTAHIFDYGEDSDIAFERKNGKLFPVFPYRWASTGSISLVERAIPFIDDACLSNYKLRIARQKMPAPPNLFIDKSMLEGVKINGVAYSPQRLIRILQDEGFLIGDSKNEWGQNTGSAKPVNPIGTDVINQLMAWRQDREDSIVMVDKVTGVNDVFSAQTPQRTTAVGVTNTLMEATQNSLTPIIKAHQHLYESAERVKMHKWQVVAAYISDEDRKRMSISRSLRVVKISADLKDYDFDLKVHAAINEQEKAELLQDIKDMRNLRRQAGSGGINEADYILLYHMIKSGKLTQAQLALAQIIENREQQDAQKQQSLAQQNQQSQIESAKAAEQGKQQTQAQKGDIDLRNKEEELKLKYQLEAMLHHQQSIADLRQKAVENIWGHHNKKSA